MKKRYQPSEIEPKWQQAWEDSGLFLQTESQEVSSPEDKMYLLFAFAYPSGAGLHVGHVESKTALDILARYYRMNGKKVFFPVGWDAFGLPAENYAIKTGVPPQETTRNAITTFRRQIKRIGISYDWANEIAACHPHYYRWTQWLFLQLYKKGLAYKQAAHVNWCPSCQTVLANEQVIEGKCERCDSDVIQKDMEQWFFKITHYTEELISGLDHVDWIESTKIQQKEWIGKKEGVQVTFRVQGTDISLPCFTTRIDTIYGVTYCVIAPEKVRDSGLLDRIPAEYAASVSAYLETAGKKTEEQRKVGEKEKTGVPTGLVLVNPVTHTEIPLYVADYVLAGYGTGVVMGVPAHDSRDHAFAVKHSLPIIAVIHAPQEYSDGKLYTGSGVLHDSGIYTGLHSDEAKKRIVADHPDSMQLVVNYALRDWLISRQRYWGPPIPIVYDPEGNAHPVKEEHLPWMLPEDVDFRPTGESPLTRSKELIERTERLYGTGWRPEVDTIDTFVDSSWYFLRYPDSRNDREFASAEMLRKWQPVDFYMIGKEHIVLHLLYARFCTKFLRDEGYLRYDEPFPKMRHQGVILGPDNKKMSKSKGNVINPDDVIEEYGADTLRMYEMFMGPIDADKPWDDKAVSGIFRFLSRVYTLCQAESASHTSSYDQSLQRALHRTIYKVGTDIPAMKFNTAISAMMIFVNEWQSAVATQQSQALATEDIVSFIKILAPFAPFIAEELYAAIGGNSKSIHVEPWPMYDSSSIQDETTTIQIQINGKVRASIQIPTESVTDQEFVEKKARVIDTVAKWMTGTVKKVIYIPGKVLNFVLE